MLKLGCFGKERKKKRKTGKEGGGGGGGSCGGFTPQIDLFVATGFLYPCVAIGLTGQAHDPTWVSAA